MNSNIDLEELWRIDHERKAKELESVRILVSECGGAIPDDLLERLLRLFPTDAKSVLMEHTGFVFAQRRQHYRAALSVARVSLGDLEMALLDFAEKATADDAQIMTHKNKHQLEAIEKRIQKELFSTANAMASLVDHSRRLQNRFEIQNYNENRTEFFREDGLHDLIIGLRVLLHHLHIVEAGWSLSADYRTGEKGASFKIDKGELKRAIEQFPERFGGNKGAKLREFVENCSDQIDLLVLFKEYGARLERFHVWLNGQIDDQPPVALADYDRCILELERHSTRVSWNALIGNWLNWEKVPDIHKHLPNFLSPEQQELVYALPRNSAEQADAIIEIIDEKNAIDVPLRERVHRLFERLAEQELSD